MPDEALPSERDPADACGISRVTVREAIDGPVAEHLLNRRHGSGTFVAARTEKNVSSVVTSFTEDMRAGLTPGAASSDSRDRSTATYPTTISQSRGTNDDDGSVPQRLTGDAGQSVDR